MCYLYNVMKKQLDMTTTQFEALFTEEMMYNLQEKIKHGYLADPESTGFVVMFEEGKIYLDLSFTISENTRPGSWALENIVDSHNISVDGYSTFYFGTDEEAEVEGNIEDLSQAFIDKLNLVLHAE